MRYQEAERDSWVMGKKAKMKVKTPETSMGNEHHCRGGKPKLVRQKSSDSTGRSHGHGSTNSLTDNRTLQRRHKITPKCDLVTKNDDDVDDEGLILSQPKR